MLIWAPCIGWDDHVGRSVGLTSVAVMTGGLRACIVPNTRFVVQRHVLPQFVIGHRAVDMVSDFGARVNVMSCQVQILLERRCRKWNVSAFS